MTPVSTHDRTRFHGGHPVNASTRAWSSGSRCTGKTSPPHPQFHVLPGRQNGHTGSRDRNASTVAVAFPVSLLSRDGVAIDALSVQVIAQQEETRSHGGDEDVHEPQSGTTFIGKLHKGPRSGGPVEQQPRLFGGCKGD